MLRTLGTPTADSWPQWSSLPDSSKITFAFEPGVDLGDLLEDTPQHTVDLIKGLLVYNSEKRVSAADCLRHPFFFTDPMPTHFSKLPLPPQQPLRFRKCDLDFQPIKFFTSHIFRRLHFCANNFICAVQHQPIFQKFTEFEMVF